MDPSPGLSSQDSFLRVPRLLMLCQIFNFVESTTNDWVNSVTVLAAFYCILKGYIYIDRYNISTENRLGYSFLLYAFIVTHFFSAKFSSVLPMSINAKGSNIGVNLVNVNSMTKVRYHTFRLRDLFVSCPNIFINRIFSVEMIQFCPEAISTSNPSMSTWLHTS